MSRYLETTGFTGPIFEADVLGQCGAPANGHKPPFGQAIREVENFQPYDPSAPDKRYPLAAMLHAMVGVRLGLYGKKRRQLQLLTAVGSDMDEYYGTDCFLRWRGRRVNIDVTLNPHKANQDGASSLTLLFDPEEKDETLAQQARRYAKQIAYMLRHQRSRPRGGIIVWHAPKTAAA